MITRVNLIEAQPFTFTYLKLVQVGAVIVGVVLLASGFQYFQGYRYEKKLETAKSEFKKLEKEHEILRAKPVKQKVDMGRYQELYDKIYAAPQWSKLLNDISLRMPGRLELTNFKSIDEDKGKLKVANKSSSKKDPKTEDDKKADDPTKVKPKAPEKIDYSVRKLEISGLSMDARTLTDFLKKLNDSEYFKNSVLSESHKDAFGYSFKILCEATNSAK